MVSHMREMLIGVGFWGLDRTRRHWDISGYYEQCSSDDTRLGIAPEFSVPLGRLGRYFRLALSWCARSFRVSKGMNFLYYIRKTDLSFHNVLSDLF